MRERTY